MYIYTTEYLSAFRKNQEILTPATIQMRLEGTGLSESVSLVIVSDSCWLPEV